MTFPFFGPKIRKARPKDVDQLSELYFEFFNRFNMEQTLTGVTKELVKTHDDRQFCANTIQSYFDEGYILLVAEKDDQIIGLISGTIHLNPLIIHHPEAEIIDWFVTEDYRQKGIGRKLYATFISEIKSQGCKSISVEAFAENTKTIATYERLGFVKDSVILKKIL